MFRYEATRKHAIPFLESISGDSEVSIRQNLCPQVTKIAKFCVSHGAEDGYRAVLDIILPVMAHLLEDEKQEVRQAACSTVVSFSTILTPLDLGQHVLTIILVSFLILFLFYFLFIFQKICKTYYFMIIFYSNLLMMI